MSLWSENEVAKDLVVAAQVHSLFDKQEIKLSAEHVEVLSGILRLCLLTHEIKFFSPLVVL